MKGYIFITHLNTYTFFKDILLWGGESDNIGTLLTEALPLYLIVGPLTTIYFLVKVLIISYLYYHKL